MARNNNNFLHKKTLITANSVTVETLDDSTEAYLTAIDSDQVKTVKNFPGANILVNSLPPSAIADQQTLITQSGALTTGGILTISRDGGNSFINFDSSLQFYGTDSTLNVSETPTGFDFFAKYPATPVPFFTTSPLTINLNTPVQNQQDLLHFFNVNAGAETDEIHSVQILDSATISNYDYALEDEFGVTHYLNLLDSIPYGDPRLTYTNGDNEVDIISGQRLWQGIKGARLANSVPEFTLNPANNIYTRNIGSRLRFRTRKSVPSTEPGGAPASYKLNAPEGQLGVGVSSPVYSKVSARFVYKFLNATQAQGSTSGYMSGYTLYGPGGVNKIDKFSFVTDGNASDVGNLTVQRLYASGQSSVSHGYNSGGSSFPGSNIQNIIDKFPFAVDGNASDVGDLTATVINTSGQSSTTHGFASGGAPGSRTLVNKFPFATDANAVDAGDLSRASSGSAGISSATDGYDASHFGIDKFPFSSFTTATDVGDLSAYRFSIYAGQNSGDNGYTSGGVSPGVVLGNPPWFPDERVDVIDKFPFSSFTTATDIGNLTVRRAAAAGQSSTVFGYTSGGLYQGSPGPPTNTIDKFPFASDTNASDVGDLSSVGMYQVAGQQV